MENKRLESLDGIRGIAACVIAFVWHYQHFEPDTRPFYRILKLFYEYGYLAVEIFFLLSGFVMAYCYREKITNGLIDFKSYLVKRIKHIYPLMLITLVVVAMEEIYLYKITGTTFVYENLDVLHFIYNLLMIQNGWFESSTYSFNGPVWCISIELFCYILFYFVIKNTEQKNQFWVELGIAAASLAVIYTGWNYPILNHEMSLGILCFFAGCLLQELYFCKETLVGDKGNRFLAILFAVSVVVCFAFTDKLEAWCGDVLLVFSIFGAPLFLWCVLKVKMVGKFFSWRIFRFLGGASMYIYFWHFPIQCAFRIVDITLNLDIDYSRKTIFLLYAVITLGIAVLSQMCIKIRNEKDHMVKEV